MNIYNPNAKSFTPQDIGNMSAEEFAKYEPEIMKQIKDGSFNSNPNNPKTTGDTEIPYPVIKQYIHKKVSGSFPTKDFLPSKLKSMLK